MTREIIPTDTLLHIPYNWRLHKHRFRSDDNGHNIDFFENGLGWLNSVTGLQCFHAFSVPATHTCQACSYQIQICYVTVATHCPHALLINTVTWGSLRENIGNYPAKERLSWVQTAFTLHFDKKKKKKNNWHLGLCVTKSLRCWTVFYNFKYQFWNVPSQKDHIKYCSFQHKF